MRKIRFERDGSLKFQVYLPPDLAKRFAERVLDEDRDLSQLARVLIRDGLGEKAKVIHVPKKIYIENLVNDERKLA